MTSTPQPAGSAASNLAAALDQLWTRFLPEIRNRVDLLDAAATACAANKLSTEQRDAAQAAAHKLAGTLGTFSLDRGTDLAREFELALASEDTPCLAVANRLAELAAELRSIVDSRKDGASPVARADSEMV
jgi:HPt (histidine-containing phosphotransfer) domain-containing protein